MKKSKILVPALAVLALGMAGAATSTVAWYTATNKVAVTANSAASSAIESTDTTLNLGSYSINFTISAASVELSYNDQGTLYRGVYYSNGGGVKEEALAEGTVGNCVKAITVTAEWVSLPSDANDVAALKGKTLSGGSYSAAGQVKLVDSSSAFTDVTDYTSGTFTVAIANADTLDLTVTLNHPCFRINTNNRSGAESDHGSNDKINIAETSLTY